MLTWQAGSLTGPGCGRYSSEHVMAVTKWGDTFQAQELVSFLPASPPILILLGTGSPVMCNQWDTDTHTTARRCDSPQRQSGVSEHGHLSVSSWTCWARAAGVGSRCLHYMTAWKYFPSTPSPAPAPCSRPLRGGATPNRPHHSEFLGHATGVLCIYKASFPWEWLDLPL